MISLLDVLTSTKAEFNLKHEHKMSVHTIFPWNSNVFQYFTAIILAQTNNIRKIYIS